MNPRPATTQGDGQFGARLGLHRPIAENCHESRLAVYPSCHDLRLFQFSPKSSYGCFSKWVVVKIGVTAWYP